MRWQPQPLLTRVHDEVVDWAIRQFEQLGGVLEEASFEQLNLKASHAAPLRPRDGMVVYADGTDWNPGSGEGLYVYYGSSWNYLG